MAGALAELKGAKECREALQEFSARVQRDVGRRSLRAAAAPIKAAVEAGAPVSSRPDNPSPGSLRGSGIVASGKKGRGGAKSMVAVAVVFTDPAAVPYEYGTTKQPARPWFRVAVDASEGAAIAAFETALRVELIDAAERSAAKKV